MELTFFEVLKIPVGYRIWFAIIAPIGMIWGFFSQMILLMIDAFRRQNQVALPRVVMPQNCGFDAVIDYYTEYEAQCSWKDAADQSLAHSEKREYETNQRELKKLKKEVEKEEDLTFGEKQREIYEIDKIMSENEKEYKDKTEPFL